MEELEVKYYKLDDDIIKQYYQTQIDSTNCRSVTFTLNPKLYSADILTQYRTAIKDILTSNIFVSKIGKHKNIHPDFEELILVPELTNTINIHFHGYFKCNPEKITYFYNEFKKYTYNNPVMGRQMMFKEIDSLTDTLKSYPFKDIKELLKFPDSKKIYIIRITKKNI